MVRSPINSSLLSYWRSLRQDGQVPNRSKVDPGQIGWCLSRVFLLEPAANGGLSFRLAGSDLCFEFGTELRGRTFASLWSVTNADRIASVLGDVIDTGDVGLLQATAAPGGAQFEILLLPLTSRSSIDRILGAAVRTDSTSGSFSHWELTSRTIMAPDHLAPGPAEVRAQHAVAQELKPSQRPTLVPHPSSSRRRPTLRVLEGGRSSSAQDPRPAATYTNDIITFTDG
jgi:hypothetical protein